MSGTHLIEEFDGNVLTLRINRPEVRNALNEDLMTALRDAFAEAGKTTNIRAILLTAEGDKAFCAGGDLNPKARTFGFDYSVPRTVYADLLRVALDTPVPVIGRINGHCLAGGMGLLAICDMAVASSHARFGLPEVKVGLFPMQVGALLRSMIPPRKFAEMCFTGETITADEALALGLVNYVSEPDELDAKVDWLIRRTIDKSPAGIRRGKHALGAIAGMSTAQAISFMEGQVGLVSLTDDAREGLAAFAEKRAPLWTGT